MGFWGEYTVLRAGRGSKKLVQKTYHKGKDLCKFLGGAVKGALKNCWQEITEPFRRFNNGIRNIAVVVKEERKNSNTQAVKQGAAYLGRGVKRYYPLLKNILIYVMPVVAAGVLVYTVRTVLGYNYALAVEVNGKVVGHVATEQIFDEASAEIAQRIKPVNDEKVDWNIQPTYTIAVSDNNMQVNEVADAILKASSNEIVDATALYVNGKIVGVTTDGDQLEAHIAALKAPYEDPSNPNLRVEFTKEIATEDGIYAAKSLASAQSIIDMLDGEEQGELVYKVKEGDSPSGIASSHGLSTQQLVDMNPQQDILNNLHIGDDLIIQQSMPYLEVRRIEKVTEHETIKFTTKKEDSEDLSFGQTKTVQNGEDGLDEVVYENVYYGDSDTPAEHTEIQRTRIKDPVPEIIQQGKKLQNGSYAQVGSGVFMWPVPGYRYVSRWGVHGHKGADICGAYGTTIYAADSGVVTTAGWHRDFGNYVIINHGNGIQTLYAHCSRLAVTRGQSVKQGEPIAFIGSTGDSTGNHCHFEIRINGVRTDPHNFFTSK